MSYTKPIILPYIPHYSAQRIPFVSEVFHGEASDLLLEHSALFDTWESLLLVSKYVISSPFNSEVP